MHPPRYLTKSRFKMGLECSTKLHYTRKQEYFDNKLENDFLIALAKGGFQVGELAKCYFPGGINIDELDYEIALSKTKKLLEQDNVIIYEAAFLHATLFIRADVVVKNGRNISLYEVKAKSAISQNECMTIKSGLPNADWKFYLYDIAFQKYVVQRCLPNYKIVAYLMVADKSVKASVNGLNQKFFLGIDQDGRTKVTVIGDVSEKALGEKVLCSIPVDEQIDRIYAEDVFDTDTGSSFKRLIDLYAKHYESDELLQGKLGSHCKNCEFKAPTSINLDSGLLNGFQECWTRVHGFSVEDFLRPSVLDIWNSRSKDKFISEGRFFQSQITPEDLLPKAKAKPPIPVGLSNSDRQILQVTKSSRKDLSIYIDKEGLKDVFSRFRYPLHFIDFETTAVAIPFHQGRRPYEQIAFQFSHHIVYEDGTIAHKGEWINTEPGKFPNFDFVRALKKELDSDAGTIFRYAIHENMILNKVLNQLQESEEPDRTELCTWIKEITKSSESQLEKWEGERSMIDLLELVKRFYFAPQTNGSNSIKHVLPALLNTSSFLKKKYSAPIYGSKIKSLNFSNHVWITFDANGNVVNPYKLLIPIFDGVDPEMLDEVLTSDEGEIRDGGAAMMAYAQIQFTQMSNIERTLITQSLLRYCELDTLAMVMLWEEWNYQLMN